MFVINNKEVGIYIIYLIKVVNIYMIRILKLYYNFNKILIKELSNK